MFIRSFNKKNILILSTLIVLLLTSCGELKVEIETNPTTASTQSGGVTPTGESGSPTHTPDMNPVETAVSTDTVETMGAVAGQVCYPSEFIPAMTAYFTDVNTGERITMPIAENQPSYSFTLPAGLYTAFSWREGYEIGQGYSNMVSCGEYTCADSLIAFEVIAGKTLDGINLCDPLPAGISPVDILSGSPSPQGLILGDLGGQYILNSSGQPEKILEAVEVSFSPDGQYAVYTENEDLWLLERGTGNRKNLTETPDRIERSPIWWAQRPGAIVFSSYNREGGMNNPIGPNFYPSIIDISGANYRVLEQENDVYMVAASPDGENLAYGTGPTAWIHNLNTGERKIFNPLEYGLDLSSNFSIAAPSWSPDGRKIAWTLGEFYADGSNQIYVAVFNLDEGTANLIHPYEVVGIDGLPGPAKWTPDGGWLILDVWAMDQTQAGTYAARPDGSQEVYLGNFFGAVLSPDGHFLAYNIQKEADTFINFVRIGSWEMTETSFGIPNSWLLAWLPVK